MVVGQWRIEVGQAVHMERQAISFFPMVVHRIPKIGHCDITGWDHAQNHQPRGVLGAGTKNEMGFDEGGGGCFGTRRAGSHALQVLEHVFGAISRLGTRVLTETQGGGVEGRKRGGERERGVHAFESGLVQSAFFIASFPAALLLCNFWRHVAESHQAPASHCGGACGKQFNRSLCGAEDDVKHKRRKQNTYLQHDTASFLRDCTQLTKELQASLSSGILGAVFGNVLALCSRSVGHLTIILIPHAQPVSELLCIQRVDADRRSVGKGVPHVDESHRRFDGDVKRLPLSRAVGIEAEHSR